MRRFNKIVLDKQGTQNKTCCTQMKPMLFWPKFCLKKKLSFRSTSHISINSNLLLRNDLVRAADWLEIFATECSGDVNEMQQNFMRCSLYADSRNLFNRYFYSSKWNILGIVSINLYTHSDINSSLDHEHQ